MANSEQSTPSSPLAEASPASLEELMSRNPRDYSDADKIAIVREYRLMRERWKVAEAAGATRAPKAAAKPKTTLDDLGL